jgi:aminoglycoside phosphotransferase (APT) family kinase protein
VNDELETRIIADAIADDLRARHPAARDVCVTAFDVARNGASNANWFFEATWLVDSRPCRQQYVARAQVPGSEVFFENDLFLQWDMMEGLAARSTVPVPGLLTARRGDDLIGRPFFVMEMIPGRVPANGNPGHHAVGWVRELAPDARRRLYENALDALVELHRVDPARGFEFLERGDPGDTPLARLNAHLMATYEWAARGRRFPVAEAAFEFLRSNEPTGAQSCLTWGDARVGNMVFADDLSVNALLDWEMAELAPPEVDLAWWNMFERSRLSSAGVNGIDGVPDASETTELYEQRLGRPVVDLHYFDVLVAVRRLLVAIRIFSPEPDRDLTVVASRVAPLAALLDVAPAVTLD